MLDDQITAQQKIFTFLTETNEIYNLVKRYSILIEEILPKNKAPLHPANELKSLVFHLYKIAESPIDVDENITEAKEHLCRAFYDSHTLLFSIYIKRITSLLLPYKENIVDKAFPDYRNIIRPAIRELQDSLYNLRSNRNTDITIINTNLKEYQLQIATLAKFEEIIERTRPVINKFQKKDEQKIIVEIVGVIIFLAVMFMVGYYFGSR